MDYPSRLLSETVGHFKKLPGIGERTALRMVLYLLKQSPEHVANFGTSLQLLHKEVSYCEKCYNISDTQICNICTDKSRNQSIICVVENLKDIISIEKTQQFRGVYHVLGGIISPLDGIGPSQLNIDSLIHKIQNGEIHEVIMALSATMEGDTTNYYLYKKLHKINHVTVTTIARGIAIGEELEQTDELTLGRSIVNRSMYENSLAK